MDDSYLYTPPNPSVGKSVKWIIVLLLLRAKNPLRLTAFLSLNPTIRNLINDWLRDHTRLKDPETVDRRSRKLANLATVGFLFSAVANNPQIPKDYWSIYFYTAYFGELNPPSSRITVYPTLSKATGIDKLKKKSWVRYLYNRKHHIIYPIIFGQLLSNYLTPTKYKLNHKYLSASIKNYIFNPIWINFRLGVNSQSVHWAGLLQSYVKHNVVLFGVYALLSFKDRLLDRYYEVANGSMNFTSIGKLLRQYLIFVGHKANAMANFIYGPNLTAMFLLALTSPMLTRVGFLREIYFGNMKTFVKNYIKGIGFVSAFATMSLGSLQLVQSFGYKRLPGDPKNIRQISTDFYNGLNSYLLRLIILSKWRIVKENHKWFSIINIANWDRIESFILCYGVWNLMNLNDYILKHPLQKECQRLEKNSLIRAVNRIMN
ncbi:hypothetical protein FT663_02597 [Candidozyma haemuli var. vulneris]|uniref:Uncharacterized protein n=1 Tax=Candidozyma haemuli TaxID=45357 RepID=A0A2V1B172_9ASCO|nr:hypothetical protein CXQ85_002686 [[Candida] haemuloni]KAF3991724.1 hypothetical protein FT663_02597 [[Candida] haemuloni var. vulneris]KAF3992079.1 hypothetical protein FT662_01388 [[Candida] haemuloni var. vulneris]PVH22961.1 hypothetical protein CXQ85_002686 [[Candida] haemuloni]